MLTPSSINRSVTLSKRLSCSKIPPNNPNDWIWFANYCLQTDKERAEFFALLQDETMSNRLDTVTLVCLISVYIAAMIFGAVGNAMVIYAVARNKRMRTPRNVFIVNLAVSDFTLCLFTQPFNLLRLLSNHVDWPLGNVMCKLTSMFQATNVYVSTISISAIALDRFQVIVYPTRPSLQRIGVLVTVFSIWLLSLLMASVLVFFTSVTEGDIFGKKRLACSENLEGNSSLKTLRLVYTILSLLFQYVTTLLIISVAYHFISRRVRHRMINKPGRSSQNKLQNGSSSDQKGAGPSTVLLADQNDGTADRKASKFEMIELPERRSDVPPPSPLSEIQMKKQLIEARRQRRTNILLTSMAVVFGLSWLPLNINNLLMEHLANSANLDVRDAVNEVTAATTDLGQPTGSGWDSWLSSDKVTLITGICLLCALMSACANPVLYGWLNENFRKEFKIICRFRTRQEDHDKNTPGRRNKSEMVAV